MASRLMIQPEPARRLRPIRVAAALIALFSAALVAAGCGSSKKSTSTTSSKAQPIVVSPAPAARLPTPKEPLNGFERRLAATYAAAARGDCGPVNQFGSSAGFRLPCAPGKAEPPLSGFKVTGSATYGTGAVVEFTSADVARPRHNLSIPGVRPRVKRPTGFLVLALTPAGTYGYVGAGAPPIFDGPFTGTSPNGWSGADGTAVLYLESVRNSDCATWFKYSATPSGMSQQQACSLGLERADAPLRQALNSGQPIKLYHLGGNAAFYFYGLRLGQTVGTLSVVRDQPPAPPFVALGAVRAP